MKRLSLSFAFIAFLLSGSGKAWADDLQLLVDAKTVLDTDHEFDGGSRITFTTLTPVQIDNLSTLGKVWGFVKYHHPQVTAGKRHFDCDLLRVLPAILAADDRKSANDALLHWIEGLGKVTPCKQCAALHKSELYFRPDLDWLSDRSRLGPDLARRLRNIHDNRPMETRQFYVSLAPGVGNPVFHNERNYLVSLPDPGFQILALFRYWNIIEYWYPYRDLIGDKTWDAILSEFLPRITLAKDRDSFQQEMLALVARIQDTHANLWGSTAVRLPVGGCQLPVVIRFVENRPVVAGYWNPESGKATGLAPGDVIEELDGAPVSDRIRQWMPYYAASNETRRLRDIGNAMTRGDCDKALPLRIQRGAETLELKAGRVASSQIDPKAFATHDRPGEAFQLLSPDVAYLKLSGVKAAEAPRYIDAAAKTKGLIIDIRTYPSESMIFALGELLVDRPTQFARFTVGDLSNPGAFYWGGVASLRPRQPHYSGKIVILVDETSMSHAEYTTMAFRSARGAKVIGSTTAAADGNVSQIPLIGGINTLITGIGVFYPDKRPTQRIGIIPDREVKPTIAGIRDGRDEVLEAAVREVLGPDAAEAEVRRIAGRNEKMQHYNRSYDNTDDLPAGDRHAGGGFEGARM